MVVCGCPTAPFALRCVLLPLTSCGRDVGRLFPNVRQQSLDRHPDSLDRHLPVREFLHWLEDRERRDSGETAPDFNWAVSGPGSHQLGQLLGRAEVFGIMNLCGSRFVERSEGRDIIACVNREGVHSDTIHHSTPTKSQAKCSLSQENLARSRTIGLQRPFKV